MVSKLEQAAEIFIKLGWEEANLSETPTLNIGTKEEQKIAKEGLKSGEWGEFREISPNTYGYVELVDVDMEKLSLFAIRVGVDAKRAVNILTRSSKEAFEIIRARGEKYATDFIASACVSSRRGFEHSATRFADLCVKLIYELNLEIPQNLEYIKDWAVITGRALDLDVEDRVLEENKFDLDLDYLKTRFQEHIKMGISVNTPSTGPFSEVLTEGVKRGFLSREFAFEQIFFALDAAIRQGDRKAWVKALEKLNISEEDILAREQNLIPVLSMGDSFLIETFAPVLIHGASEELIPSILISSFSCKVKKTLQMILKTASERKKPQHAEDLKDWIFELIKEEDKKISSAATLLAKKWDLQMQEYEEEESEILGLWRETPKLWTVPEFNLSSKTLSELIVEHSKRKAAVHDLDEERLLALTNHMAQKNPKDAKLHFVGIRNHDIFLLYALAKWSKNEELKAMMDNYDYDYSDNEKKPVRKGYDTLIGARNSIVIKHIETLPCILSTPSFDDLSISFSDLKNRILTYVQNGFSYVFEPDLQLALARLDVKSATKEDIEELKNFKVEMDLKLSVKLPSGRDLYEGNELYEFDEVDLKSNFEEDKKAPLIEEFNQKNAKNHRILNALDVILEYIKEPFKEPEDFYSSLTKYWGYRSKLEMPKALKDFPYRLYYANDEFYCIFPMFGDFALTPIRRDTEVYHGQGLILKQAVRRRTSFEKAASINLLAIGSYLSDENAQDALEAIHEAWERGLLTPKVADVNLLDWDNEAPSNLASFAKSLDDRAQEGMLSVVWPVINDMIALSLKQQRMISGTVDLVKLVKKFLPEVLYAVKTGAASAEELKMDGIGTLSKKSGSSLAVTTAKEIMEMLSKEFDLKNKVLEKSSPKPADKKEDQKKEKKEELLEIRIPETSFDLFWKYYSKENPILEDYVKMDVTSVQTMVSKKALVFDLFLPDVPDKLYKVCIYDWIYSLESEGQVSAIECPIEEKEFTKDIEKQLELLRQNEHQVWLYYDAKKKKICVSNFRNTQKGNGPLQRAAYPLSSTLKTISLALIAQDGESIYSALRLVREFVKTGEIGIDMTKKTMDELLKHEDVSPAKLIRVLEQENELFSALWPILTTSVQKAGRITKETKKIPTWANRVLDNCLYNAYYLKEAMRRGYIPKEDAKWEGLKEIAQSKAKSTAILKAKTLLNYFELN